MAKKEEPPLWLDAVRKFERAIGVPIEAAVRSDRYFDAVTHMKRAQAQVTTLVESVTDGWFRMLNIPAGSDIRRTREQLSRIERTLESLSKELADRNGSESGERPK